MKHIKKFFLPTLLVLYLLSASSCAPTKYHLKLGAQSQNIFINDEDVDSIESTGYHVGLTETTKYIITTINYTSTSWEVDNLVAKPSYSFSGVDFSIGPNFKYFKPHLSFGSMSLVGNEENRSFDYSVRGYGAMLSFPITNKFFIYGSYDKFSATLTEDISGFNDFEFDRVMVGIRFYIFSFTGFNNKE